MVMREADGETGGTREIVTADGSLTVPVRAGLGDPAAAPTHGPVFLRAPDTTIFVPSDWSVTFTRQGYGILSKEPPT
jgi:hypothetical protein